MQSLRTNHRWWAFHDAVVRAVHTHSSRLFARRSLTSPRIRGASAEPSWTKNAPMQVPDSSRRIPPVRALFAQARVVIADRSLLRDVSLWVAPLPTIPTRAQLEVRAPGRDHCARPGHTSRASAMLSGIISHRRPGHGTHRYRGHESVTDALHCKDTCRTQRAPRDNRYTEWPQRARRTFGDASSAVPPRCPPKLGRHRSRSSTQRRAFRVSAVVHGA